MSIGFVYLAIGSQYLEEAEYSAESVKRHMPSLPIKVFTDQTQRPSVFDQAEEIHVDKSMCYNKSVWLGRSPFQKTVFLVD